MDLVGFANELEAYSAGMDEASAAAAEQSGPGGDPGLETAACLQAQQQFQAAKAYSMKLDESKCELADAIGMLPSGELAKRLGKTMDWACAKQKNEVDKLNAKMSALAAQCPSLGSWTPIVISDTWND